MKSKSIFDPNKKEKGFRIVFSFSDAGRIIRVYMDGLIIKYEQHHSAKGRLPKISYSHALDENGERFYTLAKCIHNAKRVGLDMMGVA